MRKLWRRRHWRRRLGTLLLGTGVAGLVIAAGNLGLFRVLEWTVLDQLFHLRPPTPLDRRVVIVTIDEEDIQYAKRWPMSDRLMAKLLGKIAADKPRAIGLDIYRDIPVEPGHGELQALWEATPELVGVEKVGLPTIAPPAVSRPPRPIKWLPAISSSIAIGSIRRGVVSLQGQEGLGAHLALKYLKTEGIELRAIDEDQFVLWSWPVRFFDRSVPALAATRSSELGGYQILIDYRGPWRESFQLISMREVLGRCRFQLGVLPRSHCL